MFDDWLASLLGGVVFLSCFGGCALRGNTELLETQLRKQERSLQQYANETARLREELAVSQREMDLLRAQSSRGESLTPEEESHRLAKISGLVFNSLLTAGQSRDELAGDERFHALFYPHDADGEIVKLSGQLEVEALDLARPANQKSIGRWVYSPEEARRLWLAGFLSSGFQIDEAWQSPPQGSRILLVARLTTTDGRTFEASHTIPIDTGTATATTPRKLPPPVQASQVEPASFDAPAATRRVPEPEEWQFEIRPAPRTTPPPRETAFDPAAAPVPVDKPAATEAIPAPERKLSKPPTELPADVTPPGTARPFPAAALHSASRPSFVPVQTSDNFTEETLPVIR